MLGMSKKQFRLDLEGLLNILDILDNFINYIFYCAMLKRVW